ncbi:MAG: TGS domain-containing protein, partial [Schleiferiaceae bacterium]
MACKDTDPTYLWAFFTCSEAMIDITLPDGSVRSYSAGTTAMQVAESISRGLAQNALTAKWNGQTVELNEPLADSGTLVFFTWDQPEG